MPPWYRFVTGQVDPVALDRLVNTFLAGHGLHQALHGLHQAPHSGQPRPAEADPVLTPASRQRLTRAVLALAAGILSGPGGLAAHLRAGLDYPPLAAISLPLDIGPAVDTIPAHLRRAVMIRHPHCAFPGCLRPGKSLRRGRGHYATGVTGCLRATATAPMRSWRERRLAARTWRIWPGWHWRCMNAAATITLIPMPAMGSMTAECGWT